MCGRYQLELSAEDIENLYTLIQEVNRRYARQPVASFLREKQDVFPGSTAVVATPGGLEEAGWGFPLEKKLVFNARTESLFEKPLFRDAALHHRCLVPATLFYEWNDAKEKHEIRLDGAPLLLAGLLRSYPNAQGGREQRFTVLTKASEGAMAKIHPRAPLLLTRDTASVFLHREASEEMLKSLFLAPAPPVRIARESGPRQLSLF